MNKIKNSAISAVLVLAGVAISTNAYSSTDAKMMVKKQEAKTATTASVKRLVNGTRFGGWTVKCEAVAVNETTCVLSQQLARSTDNRFLAEMLAFWDAKLEQPYMAARVPNGVHFPSGFAMKPDGQKKRYSFIWQSCSTQICEALLSMKLEDADAFAKQMTAAVGYRPSLLQKPVVFKIKLDGLGVGLKALKASIKDAAN